MLTSEFDYHLPPELVAQKPLARRDASRMMVVLRREEKLIHARFRDFPDYLNAGDILVLNDTKVIPARLWGKKEDKDIEFLFLKKREKGLWEVLCRPARRLKAGERILFLGGVESEVIAAEGEGRRILRFSPKDVSGLLKKTGYAPLPPYIKRQKQDQSLRNFDLRRYQTVYARKGGAVAAPTAGLHFTPKILENIRKKAVTVCSVTLEVGLATFQPVRAERVEDHRMLEERYIIGQGIARKINAAKSAGQKVFAVGTTVVRTLESAFKDGKVPGGIGSTSLFIYPGFTFQVVDRLLTNFHLPRSTLLMLVSAFAGRELILRAYEEAVRQRYRFYSYGDCMLIV
ncbi:MAG: tRNA preQ1(34) S-adenosylmethionine ribosyltransferase-isomerase QueA [Clostridiales bacterium]|nr:tRNA preQ1(34) S-adenosylmethionine ribosyltransferase-isomerase QueA [Clostridiales bacterium]